MNVRQMPLEELELLSYADIAYELLKLDKKTKTTPVLFKEVCSLLEINEDAMFEMIGDFYTTLTTDKRFILLDNAEWDLKEFHSVAKIVDEEDEEEESADTEEPEKEEVEIEDEAVIGNEEEYDDDDDDLSDLAILTEEELEEE
ncbi:MAG: DNA-directed RNA polymerase subunit delta [Tenericutes bacterium]|nr:DNA-directed RNA polymerase subunit delta [Mycoplasmatota bacterium]